MNMWLVYIEIYFLKARYASVDVFGGFAESGEHSSELGFYFEAIDVE